VEACFDRLPEGPEDHPFDRLLPIRVRAFIVLTMALHAIGVVIMALAGMRIRLGLESWNLRLRHAIAVLVAVIGAAGLLLACYTG
jgi:hypothetical protein